MHLHSLNFMTTSRGSLYPIDPRDSVVMKWRAYYAFFKVPEYLSAVSVPHRLLNSLAAKCEHDFAYDDVTCIARRMVHTIRAKIMCFCCPVSIINQCRLETRNLF